MYALKTLNFFWNLENFSISNFSDLIFLKKRNLQQKYYFFHIWSNFSTKKMNGMYAIPSMLGGAACPRLFFPFFLKKSQKKQTEQRRAS